jgi:hypothetical protein
MMKWMFVLCVYDCKLISALALRDAESKLSEEHLFPIARLEVTKDPSRKGCHPKPHSFLLQ